MSVSKNKSQIRTANRMKVANMAFLLERLAKDCSLFQFIRELTQNAIEAIIASNKPGVIHWCVDSTEVIGPNKLCIIDTGIGMEPDSMMLYLNNISCSSAEQGIDGNFGFGGKITAVAENPYGVLYYSWTGTTPEGGAILIGRDGDYYGAKDILSEGDGQDHLAVAPNEYMPDDIKMHGGTGTKVILGGKNKNDNTSQPIGPDGKRMGGQWISRYLNERYFRIPESVNITCDEYRSDGGSNPRTVHGHGWLNDKCKVNDLSGVITLPNCNARAHWWVLRTKEDLKKFSDPSVRVKNATKSFSTNFNLAGHTGFLYKNEIYSMSRGSQAISRLHKCGILFGSDRVIIYIEPLDKSVISNTSRTQLTSDGVDLDWDVYASEFRTRMPVVLSEFVDSIGSNAERGSVSAAHKERIMEVVNLFATKEVIKPSSTGSKDLDEDPELCGSGEDGGSGGPDTDTGTTHKPSENGLRKNNHTKIKAGAVQPRGRKGVFSRTIELPNTVWKSLTDGTRTPDEMENRIGEYDDFSKTLYLNADYFGYLNWIDHFVAQYPAADFNQVNVIRTKITGLVRHHFELILLESVVTYPELTSMYNWPNNGHISSTELTLAIQPRYHLNHAIKRDIHQELGQPTRNMSVRVSFGSLHAPKPTEKSGSSTTLSLKSD
jgi:hypothetical protein